MKSNAINERQGTLITSLQKAMQSIDANALSQPFIKAMDLIDRVKNQMMQKCISRPKLKGQKEMHRMPMRRLAQHQRGVHLGCLPPIPIQITNAIWAACLPYRFKLLMLFGLPATHTDFSYQC